jgi:hypothetical protein
LDRRVCADDLDGMSHITSFDLYDFDGIQTAAGTIPFSADFFYKTSDIAEFHTVVQHSLQRQYSNDKVFV